MAVASSHRVVRILVAALLAVGATGALSHDAAEVVQADEFAAFGERARFVDRGNITMAANTSLTCLTFFSSCTGVRSGSIDGDNDDFVMTAIDADGLPDTFNSSSAQLAMPAGSTVLFAGLYWGAMTDAGFFGSNAPSDGRTMSLRTPTSGNVYTEVTASTFTTADDSTYSSFADVTDIVAAAGAGTYWGADVPAATGFGRYGGWSLVVAYANPQEPLRDLVVYDGFHLVEANDPLDLTIPDLRTLPSGPIDATVGWIGLDGDQDRTGDQLQVTYGTLVDAQNPNRNVANSTVSDRGAAVTTRAPAYANTLGLDADLLSADQYVWNYLQSLPIEFRATGADPYYVNAVTLSIDRFQPRLGGQGTKTVTDVDGAPTVPGDVLEYQIRIENTGTAATELTTLTDVVPAGTTYVPGSMRTVASTSTPGNVGRSWTDALHDDNAQIDTTTNTLIYWSGTNARPYTGGALQPGQYEVFAFRVRVDGTAGGGIVSNTGQFSFRGQNIAGLFEADTNTVDTVVSDVAVDLALTKSDSIDPVVAGAATTYQLVVTNNGGVAATDVALVDDLPAGFSFDPDASDDRCTAVGQQVTCALGTIDRSANTLVEIGVRVAPSAPAAAVVNEATVSSAITDVDERDNTASETTTIVRQSSFRIDKQAAAPTAAAGGTTSFTVTAVNDGPSDAANVQIVDTLPVGLVATAAPAGCVLTGADRIVNCPGLSMAVGVPVELTIPVRVTSTVAAGTELINSVLLRDPSVVRAEASATIQITAEADLAVTKTLLAGPVVAGRAARFGLGVTNAGPSPSSGVVVTDTLPAGFTFDPATSGASCTADGQEVTCSLGDLAPGASTSVVVGVTTDPALGDGTSSGNQATVTSASVDPSPADNTTTLAVPVVRRADLRTIKTSNVDVLVAGGAIEYTVLVQNLGPSNASSVVVTDQLPPALTLRSAAVTSGAGTCTDDGTTVTCDVDALAVGASSTITIVADADPALAQGTLIANSAAAAAAETDPAPTNNVSTNSTSVAVVSGLTVVKDDLDDPAIAGGPLRYRITVGNLGPSVATDIALDDVLPDVVEFVSAVTDQGSCSLTGTAPDRFQCDLGTLAVGEEIVVDLTTTVDPSAANELRPQNVVTVTATGTGDIADDSRTLILRESDLAVTTTAPPSVVAGGPVVYTLQVTNGGLSDASDVVLTDVLPTGFVLTSVTSDAGDVCTDDGSELECAFGDLPAGASRTVTLTGAADGSLADGAALVNVATVAATETDPVAANNRSETTTSVSRSADLQLSAVALPEPVEAGEILLVQLTIDNLGPSTASGLTVVHQVPAGLSLDTTRSTVGCVAATPDEVVCTLPGAVAAGDDAGVDLYFDVDAGIVDGTVLTYGSTVTAAESDPVGANNTASTQTTVVRRADVAVNKLIVSPVPAAAGTEVVYRVAVVNSGPSVAEGVVVTDVLPPGVAFVSADAPCVETTPGTVTCDVGTVDVDERVEATITVGTDPGATGTLANTATVQTTTTDPEPTNDTSTASTTLATRADLTLTKTAPAEATAGDVFTYRLEMGNLGPSVAREVTIADTLPDGVSFVGSPQGGQCTGSGGAVSCTRPGDLPPGATAVFEVEVRTASSLAAGTTLTNAATVSGRANDPDLTNNAAATSVEILRSADLRIDKTALSDVVLAGASIGFDIVVTNDGPSDASSLRLTDVLPAGTTMAGVSIGDCTPTPSGTTCTVPTLATGEQFQFRIEAYVDPSVATDTLLTNTASVLADEVDPDPDDNSATADVRTARSADIAVQVLGPATAAAGETVPYTVDTVNLGPSDASAAIVTITLPDGGSFDPAGSSDGCTLAAPGVVECTIGDLAANELVTSTVAVTFDPDAPSGTVTTAATGDATEPDTNASNDSADAQTVLARRADLVVTKTNAPDPVAAGSTLRSTIEVVNNGPSSATGVVVTDTLGAGATIVATTPGAPACTSTDLVATCTLPRVGPGETATVLVDAAIADDTPDATIVTDTAVATAVEPDPTPDDATTEADATVTVRADVELTGTIISAAPTAGRRVAIEYRMVDNGPSSASPVTLRLDTIPDGWTYNAAESPAACTLDGAGIVCEAVGLTPGESATRLLVFATDTDIPMFQAWGVTAVAEFDGDVESDNNTSTLTGTTQRLVDIAVAKSDDVDPVDAGADLTYTIDLTNAGPSDAASVALSDELPPQVTPGAATVTTGTGSCDIDGNTVTCTIERLAASGSAQVTIGATVDAATPAGTLIENTAEASTVEPEAQVADNTTTETTRVTQNVGLLLDKTARQTVVAAGTDAVFDLVVTNLGPSIATDVVVTDVLPAGLTLVTAATDQGSCAEVPPASGDIECTLGDIGPGADVTLSITATVGPATANGARITNSATAEAAVGDPASDPATIEIVRQSAFTISKSGPATADAGTEQTWTITVGNDGPSDAARVEIDDLFPAGITATAVIEAPADGDCIVAPSRVFCTPAIAAGASVDIVVTGLIAPTTADGTELINTARVITGSDTPPTATSSVVVSRRADLTITKTVDPMSATAGTDVAYTLQVDNAGPSIATGVVLTDTLPATVRAIAATTADGTCNIAATITCNLADLAVGAGATVEVTAEVASSAPAGVVVTNAAVVGAVEIDPEPSGNAASADLAIGRSADLSVSVLVPGRATAGGRFSTTIAVDNAGPSDAADVVTTVAIPPGTVVDVSTLPAECAVVAAGVQCALPTLAAGTPALWTFESDIDPTVADGEVLTTSATIASSSPDPDPGDDSDAGDTAIDRQSDLAIEKTADLDTVVAGETVAYSFVVTNDGPSFAEGVTVTDVLPPSLEVDTVTPDDLACTTSTGRSTCDLGTLAPGASVAFAVDATLDPAVLPDTRILNTASITSTSFDPVSTNDSSTAGIDVIAVADLGFTKSLDTNPVVAGDTGTFSLLVTNTGPSTARSVEVVDDLPDGLTFDAAGSSSGCAADGATVTCDVGDLAVDTSVTVRLAVSAEATLEDGAVLENTATATSDTPEVRPGSPDPDANDNSSTVLVPIARAADLVVVKIDEDDPVIAGLGTAYGIEVTNRGPSIATAIEVVDDLPTGATATSASFTDGDGTCPTDTGSRIVCDVPLLGVDESVTIRIPVDTEPTTPAGATLVDTATAVAAENDPNPAAASTTENTSVNRQAGLDLVKTVQPAQVIAGEPVTYRLLVTNRGPSAAADVRVVDQLPGQLGNPVPSVAPAGAGTCSVSATGYLDCTLGEMDLDESATITIAADVAPDAEDGALVLNTATASATAAEAVDASADFTLAAEADVWIDKDGPASVLAGTDVAYVATVGNDGPSTARGVVFTDPVPTTLTGISATVVGRPTATCSITAGVVRCPLGALDPGDEVEIRIEGSVRSSATAGTEFTNTATVSTTTRDPLPDNDSSEPVTTRIDREVDLAVTKIALQNPARAGGFLTYSFTVTNAGPSDASAVTLADELPPGTEYQAALSSLACTDTGDALSCAVGVVPAGATVSGSIVVRIDAAVADGSVITNEVVVTSAEPEAQPNDNTAQASTTVRASANLSVVKTATPPLAAAGEAQAWTIVVTNNGPSVATDVELTDTLPPGTTFESAPGCAENGGSVTCDLGSLAPLEAGEVTLTATLDPALTGTLTNSATATTTANDPNPVDNTGTSVTAIGLAAELSLAKAADTAVAAPGDTVVFTLTAANSGPSTAVDVRVEDALPDGLSFDPAGSSPSCTSTADTVTCAGGDVAPGDEVTFEVATTVGDVADGETIANDATVASATPGDDPADSRATADVTIRHEADLGVEARPQPTALAGATTTLEVEVANAGGDPALNTVVRVALPAGASFDPTGSPAECAPTSPGVVECEAGELAPGDTATLLLVVDVTPEAAAGSTLEFVATVESDTFDPDEADNEATATTEVDTSADLAISKQAIGAVVAGDTARYRLQVDNAGPSVARDVVITDTLPAGMTYDAASDPRCRAGTGRDVVCTIGDLGVGSTTVDIVVDVDPTVVEALRNQATVAASTADPAGDDNAAAVAPPTASPVDVRVELRITGSPIRVGGSVTAELKVENVGPATARDVEVTLEVGDGLTPATGPILSGFRDATGLLVVSAVERTTTIATLAPGATRTGTVRLTAQPGSAGRTIPVALVVADVANTDTQPANDRSTTPVVVIDDTQPPPPATTPPVSLPTDLPSTGSDSRRWVIWAAILVAVGALLTLTTRRRTGTDA